MAEIIHKEFPDFSNDLIQEDELVSEVVRLERHTGGIKAEQSQATSH
jgi:hypothetical protein